MASSNRGHHRGVTHDADDDVLEARPSHRSPPMGKRVQSLLVGVDEVGIMVFPTGLIASKPSMVVDAPAQHRPRGSGGSPRYRVDLPHQAPISTMTARPPSSEKARQHAAAARRASPSSSGMNQGATGQVDDLSQARVLVDGELIAHQVAL